MLGPAIGQHDPPFQTAIGGFQTSCNFVLFDQK